MKRFLLLTLLVLAGAGFIAAVAAQAPAPGARQPAAPAAAAAGAGFTYQGVLTDGSSPANGRYDFQFALFDAETGGVQAGGTLTHTDVAVADGLFTVNLDFGAAALDGGPRFLEVRVWNGSAYETLLPRQPIRPAPLAAALRAEMQPPTIISATAAAGGLLSDGTYYFKVVASDGSGTTVGSNEAACQVDGVTTNRCILAWTEVFGATAYRVYKGPTAGGQNLYQVAATAVYTYNTDIGATQGRVPTTTTAFAARISPTGSSWLLGGNVGIGTTTPAALLDVQGTIQFGAGNAEIRSSSGDNFQILTASDSPNPSFQVGIGDGIGGFLHEPIFWNANTLILNSNGLSWCPSCGRPNANHHLVIDNLGNVGIGTTAPAASLEVDGGIRARGGAPGSSGALNNGYAFSGNGGDNDSGMFSPANGTLDFYTNAAVRVRINNNGNVGIGTTTPAAALHVVSAEASAIPGAGITLSGGASGNSNIELREDAAGGYPHIDFANDPATDDFDVRLILAGDDALRIEGGFVGIGTNNPTYPLHVFGSIKAEGDICPGSSPCLTSMQQQLEAHEQQLAALQTAVHPLTPSSPSPLQTSTAAQPTWGAVAAQNAALQAQAVQIEALQAQNARLQAQLDHIQARLATAGAAGWPGMLAQSVITLAIGAGLFFAWHRRNQK